MVLLGGLEIVAAGYLIHKHNKNKKEKQRLEEEEDAAAYEEEQRARRSKNKSDHHRRRRHSSDPQGRHRRHSAERILPYGKQNEYSAPPQPVYPPTGWPAHWKQSQIMDQQSNQYPTANQVHPNAYQYPQHPQYQQQFFPAPYGQPQGGNMRSPPAQYLDVPRGRSDTKRSHSAEPRIHERDGRSVSRVRFALPDDEPQPGDALSPPPEYRV